jgi:hypothetical protein
MADPHPSNSDDIGTPRWVKVSGIIVIVVVLLVVVMMLAGHGPGRHLPRGQAPAADVTQNPTGDPASPESAH